MKPLCCFALFVLLSSAPRAQNTVLIFTHGAHEGVDVPYDPAFVPQTGLTLEAWILYDEAAVPIGSGYRWPTVCRQDFAPAMESYFLRVGAAISGNRNLEFAVRTASGLHFAVYPFAPGELDSWNHVAGTFDGTDVKIVLNGQEVASTTIAGAPQPLFDNGGVFRIGNGDESVPGYETWSGRIDEVRVWPFARTLGEIQFTIGSELSQLPGGAVSFNLNSTYVDSSSGLVGTPFGSPTFALDPNLPLNINTSHASAYGSSSATCGTISSAVGTIPTIGNFAFELRCSNAPPGGAGFLAVSLAPWVPSVPVLGCDVYIDLGPLVALKAATSGPLGDGRAPLGIPFDPGLIGVVVYTQFVYPHLLCGAAGYVSSDALAVTFF
ncbi:MAG: LamG domain-containing protein [Planctomycetota bacterium]|nr:LamG domain-containing protein [Planctomycetota bacterium]